MTNRDRADRLMAEAAEILRELTGALERRSWNLAIQRAQEAFELALKALLAEMGVDYPKIHDLAPHFVSVVRARGLNIDEAILTWLKVASGKLAARRAPAISFETLERLYDDADILLAARRAPEHGEAEAREAVSDAEKVIAFGVGFLRQLRSL